MGRSRGGLSTKIHLLADTRCRPLTTVTTAGQRHDSLALDLVMDKVCVLRPGRGRPRRRRDEVLADTAYSSKAIRAHLRDRGIRATIPLKADQQSADDALGTRILRTAFAALEEYFPCHTNALTTIKPIGERSDSLPRSSEPIVGARCSGTVTTTCKAILTIAASTSS